MIDGENAIISIYPKYADAILSGSKTVELRRRIPSLHSGTRLWIYSTRPVAAVVGSVLVKQITRGQPEVIWQKYGSQSCIMRADFDAYFRGAEEAVAIILTDALKGLPIHIEKLRGLRNGFHPPQVLAKLTSKEACSLLRWSEISD